MAIVKVNGLPCDICGQAESHAENCTWNRNKGVDPDKLTPYDYQSALDAQSACNLSGIVFSFAEIMKRLCKTVKGGTDERNHHPICRLFAEQIMYLSGGQTDDLSYSRAFDAAREECRKAGIRVP